jgi:cell division protein ZapA
MGQITLHVGGRDYPMACRDGEEAHYRRLGALLDSHSETALRASAGQPGERTLLYVALLLADQLNEGAPVAAGLDPALLDRIAERLEAVATALEESPLAP